MTSYFSHSNGTAPNGVASSPLTHGGTPGTRLTAFSNRLSSVLSSSFTDADIRDALRILDNRGIQNTAETRRTLRLDIQKEVIDTNGRIIRDFGEVAEQLRRIGAVISNLNAICQDMRKRIVLARQDAGPFLEEASALVDQKNEIETKEKLLDAFTKHYVLSDDELLLLTSSAEPVDDQFFEALSRTKRIYKDCEILLGGDNERLGLEIMEQSSKALNSAYQKLYKWIQKEFKSLNLEDPQMGGPIRKGLKVLAERPSLFHSCLDFFAEAREDILSASFHFVLTATGGGGAEPGSKPIEFNAHDPLRYVGDMLAWLYSTAVSEKEALEALFISEEGGLAKGIETGISSELWSRVDEEEAPAFDGQQALAGLVTRDLNGVCRSLRQRAELVVQGHDDPVTLYKVINLLSFYEATFSKLVGADSDLVDTVVSLQRSTFQCFEALIQDTIVSISSEPSALLPPDDLGSPDFLNDALATLTDLMKTYDSSFKPDSTDDSSQTENNFTPVVRVALDPFIQLARTSSNALSDPTEKAIYQTNSLLAIRSAISPYPFVCTTHLASISNALAILRSDLLEIQHNFLLKSSGLQTLLTALKPFALPTQQSSEKFMPEKPQLRQDLASIATLPEFQPSSLSSIGQQLDDFLPSALVDATENLKRIHSPTLVKSVTEEAVEAFCRDFEFVESVILGADEAREKVSVGTTATTTTTQTDAAERRRERRRQNRMRGEDNGEEDDGENFDRGWSMRAFFPRTTGEIRVLLS
ncbi:hypothetical protein VTO42DRAFT_7531 [Malbranchea cinnamomea]